LNFEAPQKNRAPLSSGINSAEKQKGKKEGGLGEGIPCRGTGQAFVLLRLRIERFRFSLIKRKPKQKNFLFLLKEKIAREKKKKCRENFSVLVCRSEAEASGNASHSWFRIFFEKSSDFVQNTELTKKCHRCHL
jgi:hypothetical protein